MAAVSTPTRTVVSARQVAVAVLIPIGPLAIAILRAILPYSTNDDAATVVARVADQPTVESAVLWLGLVATFAAVPGVIAVGLAAARRSVRLGTAGLVLATAGFSGLYAILGTDLTAMSAVRVGLDPGDAAMLVAEQHPSTVIATGVFVVGHVVGVTLLGLALWRGRVVPAWAGLVIAISQPLHVVFAVVVPNAMLDGLAWGLTALGFGAVALSYLRRRTQ